jgi:hypothetical protein
MGLLKEVHFLSGRQAPMPWYLVPAKSTRTSCGGQESSPKRLGRLEVTASGRDLDGYIGPGRISSDCVR